MHNSNKSDTILAFHGTLLDNFNDLIELETDVDKRVKELFIEWQQIVPKKNEDVLKIAIAKIGLNRNTSDYTDKFYLELAFLSACQNDSVALEELNNRFKKDFNFKSLCENWKENFFQVINSEEVFKIIYLHFLQNIDSLPSNILAQLWAYLSNEQAYRVIKERFEKEFKSYVKSRQNSFSVSKEVKDVLLEVFYHIYLGRKFYMASLKEENIKATEKKILKDELNLYFKQLKTNMEDVIDYLIREEEKEVDIAIQTLDDSVNPLSFLTIFEQQLLEIKRLDQNPRTANPINNPRWKVQSNPVSSGIPDQVITYFRLNQRLLCYRGDSTEYKKCLKEKQLLLDTRILHNINIKNKLKKKHPIRLWIEKFYPSQDIHDIQVDSDTRKLLKILNYDVYIELEKRIVDGQIVCNLAKDLTDKSSLVIEDYKQTNLYDVVNKGINYVVSVLILYNKEKNAIKEFFSDLQRTNNLTILEYVFDQLIEYEKNRIEQILRVENQKAMRNSKKRVNK